MSAAAEPEPYVPAVPGLCRTVRLLSAVEARLSKVSDAHEDAKGQGDEEGVEALRCAQRGRCSGPAAGRSRESGSAGVLA